MKLKITLYNKVLQYLYFYSINNFSNACYFVDDNECLEGTRGKDCLETCSINSFGNNCSKVCDCASDNICHSEGCPETPEQMKKIYGTTLSFLKSV